jgi:hypothetical protein
MISISPLLVSLEVASKDAAFVVMVMKLGANDCGLRVQPSINFRRQQHAEWRRRKINPE